MNTYIMTLLDQYIDDKSIASVAFKTAVLSAKSCKKLAKQLSLYFKCDDYELKYIRSLKIFMLRLVYDINNRYIIITYKIIPQ